MKRILLLLLLCVVWIFKSIGQDSTFVSIDLAKTAALHHANAIYGNTSFYSVIPFYDLDGQIKIFCNILLKEGKQSPTEEQVLRAVNQNYAKVKELKKEILEVQKLYISGKSKSEKIREIQEEIEKVKDIQSFKDDFITVLTAATMDQVPVILSHEGLPLQIVQRPEIEERLKTESADGYFPGEIYYQSMFLIYYGLNSFPQQGSGIFKKEADIKRTIDLPLKLINTNTFKSESIFEVKNKLNLKSNGTNQNAGINESSSDDIQKKEILNKKWKEILKVHSDGKIKGAKKETSLETKIEKESGVDYETVSPTLETPPQIYERIENQPGIFVNDTESSLAKAPKEEAFVDKSYIISTETKGSADIESETVVFYEDFSGSYPGNWTIGHDGGEGTYAWAWPGGYAHCYSNPSGGQYFYPNNLSVFMERRNVSLAGYSEAVLYFYQIVQTESGYDVFTVNIRDQNGTWHCIYSESGMQDPAEWELVQLDLSNFAGQTGLYIQFRFDSDASIQGSPYYGVFIDNVQLSAETKPNLRPYQPAGWSDEIVVSNESGTNSDTEIWEDQTAYIDVAWENNGGADAGYHVCRLYLDDVEIRWTDATDLVAGGGRIGTDWSYTFTDSGWHTLRWVVDADGNVDESEEGDNVYEKQIYINPIDEVIISGVPDYAQIDYPFPDNPGGICVATCLADILGYWDRNSYWNLIDNGKAPLLDNFYDANVEETVEWLRWRYYDHFLPVVGNVVDDFGAENGLSGFDGNTEDLFTKSELWNRTILEIEAMRPVGWGVNEIDGPGAHYLPIFGYRDGGNTTVVRVHMNLGYLDYDAWVDWYGNDGHAANTEEITKIIPNGIPSDHYETDDNFSSSKEIYPDEIYNFRQTHNFYTSNDIDVIKFQAQAARRYTITTRNLGSTCDTEIGLVGDNSYETYTIATDDDSGEGVGSQIIWDCYDATDNPFYIVVNEKYNRSGPTTNYDLEISWEQIIVPLTPNPVSPADGATVTTLTPTLTWSSFQNGGDGQTQSGFQIRVRCDTDGDAIVYETGFISSSTSNQHTYSPGSYSGIDPVTGDTRVSNALEWNKHYHWHIRYRDSGGDWSLWSSDLPDFHQDFYTIPPTFTISGYVRTSGGSAISGVTMGGLPGSPITNSSGYYSSTVNYGWSGTVTPSLAGYSFVPASSSYSNVTSNRSADYTGTQISYSISGYVRTSGGTAISGVTMVGLPGSPITNSSGYYSSTVSYGWSGTVTPSLTGYTFAPASSSYSNVTSNRSTDYTGAQQSYTIIGYVRTSGGTAISGVTMVGLLGSPVTNSSGYYSSTVSYGWSGTVTPSLTGYTFAPASSSYSNVTSNRSADYTGTILTYAISGYVRTSEGVAISGVTMGGLPGSPVTNSSGFYSASVSYGWSGTVTPTRTGYIFVPASSDYSNVTSNLSVDYTGRLRLYSISGYVLNSEGLAISNVAMSGLPGNPLTNNSGYYYAAVTYGWSGTVSPVLMGYSFTPASNSYAAVADNQTGDYAGINNGALVTDYEGNNYNILTIGTQVWLASDLKAKKYNDGSDIPLGPTVAQIWAGLSTGAYNNLNGACVYNWYAVNSGKLCPTGWHVPTDEEWYTLASYLGGESVAGGKMKSIGTDLFGGFGWSSPNEGATNESEFTALPRGYREYDGSYDDNPNHTAWYWSSSEISIGSAGSWRLYAHNASIFHSSSLKNYGFSVRCIKDSYAQQTIPLVLTEGWNILSLAVTPADNSMSTIFDPLIKAGELVKVQDEAGRSLERLSNPVGWINEIGQLSLTEGYKVRVNENNALQVTGQPVALPLDIPLESGWNIIGYPSMNPQPASTVFGALISSGALIKVQNELGQAIEQIEGTWNYGFANLTPGEGYKVMTSTGATLTVTAGAKGVILAQEKVKRETEHFRPGYVGNGLDHMNIYLIRGGEEVKGGMGEPSIGLRWLKDGDEVGVFEGDICVGACVVGGEEDRYITLTASFDDPETVEKDGFTEGDNLVLRLWNRDSGEETVLGETEPLEGYSLAFERQGTTVLKTKLAGEKLSSLGDAYPNPSRDKTTFTFSLAGESRVRLEIIDVVGNTVAIILDETMPGGIHRVEWDNTTDSGTRVRKGMYLYKMQINNQIQQTKQIVLL